MEISNRKEANSFIIKVKGRMDTITAPEFDKEFETVLQQGEKTVIIDFSDLDYISSAGLRSILSASKRLKEKGGKILLFSLKDVVKEVFEISGFSAIIPIYNNLDEALSAA